ncbi:glycerophosphodiester phosphodiesterase family protein [Streptomyces sp. NPDC026673]|uniref:glycerophosphodiester phosphodiesterase n=1 Tax=Streptomyces sp. NPDC026673 TaxID=3155724 RepID=UPI0034020239
MHHSLARTVTAAALLGVSGFVTMPAHAAPEALPSPTVFAHRGASTEAPENTLAAVRRAHEQHITWIENDVQRTKDGALVVIHDTTLARTTDVEQVFPDRSPWRVADFTLAEIQRLDAGGWFAPRYRGEHIPTLLDYLTLLDRNRQGLLLELKQPDLYPGIEKQTIATLARAGWLDADHLTGRLVIQSFSAPALRRTHELRPAVETGFLGSPPVSRLKEYAAFADQINPDEKNVTFAYVTAVHGLRGPDGKPLRVNAWTVDDLTTAIRMAALGADGIITNRPDVIRNGVQ